MWLRHQSVVAWLLGLVCVACGTQAREDLAHASAETARPRLIVYVLFDTLGASHVSHLGYERRTSPYLDALAAQGIAFENAHSPAPYAVASIPSLMTGRYPDRHGLTEYDGKLAAEETTLAESLSAFGYRTVGLSSVYNGGPHYGNDQGFDRFVEMYLGPGPEGVTRVQFLGQTCHYPEPAEYLEPVRRELDDFDPGESLFLFLHFLQPHAPYDPPEEFLSLFREADSATPERSDERERLRERLQSDSPAADDIAALVGLYDANIAFADHGLGQILTELKQRGLFDDALIVATGNHGEAFWEHAIRGHGMHLFEEFMHVPLVLKLPANDGLHGLRRDQLVSNLDCVPTILERVGGQAAANAPHQELDGKSLLPLVSGAQTSTHARLFLRSEPKAGVPLRIGVIERQAKVIVTLDAQAKTADVTSEVLYFDLSADPGELHNLAGEVPEAAERAARAALEWWRSLRGAAADSR